MVKITKPAKHFIAARPVESFIHVIRGQKVMFDADLAALYGVETCRLNEAVKRNIERFPATFMFRLTDAEAAEMRSQFATTSKRKYSISTACLYRTWRCHALRAVRHSKITFRND